MSAVVKQSPGVRAARVGASMLSSILIYSRRACEASPSWGPLGYNAVIWRQTLLDSFRDPSSVVIAALNGNDVCGLLVGTKGPLPWCAGFGATDLVFVADRGGNLLLREFKSWCREKKVRRIDMGISDTEITDEDGECIAADVMFRREGFSKSGRMYYQIMEAPK